MQNKVTEQPSTTTLNKNKSPVSLLYVTLVVGGYFEAVDEYLMLLIATKTVIYSSSVQNLPAVLLLAVLHFFMRIIRQEFATTDTVRTSF